MLGRSHLLVGAAGFFAVGEAGSHLLHPTLSGPQLAAGALVCAGGSMLNDIDCPTATVARSLGPVTVALSRLIARLAGGHRNGTHSLLAAVAVFLGTGGLLREVPGPWAALAICFFCTSLVVGTLTEASGAVCAVLSALVAATLVAVCPAHGWLAFAVLAGMLLHDLGDVLTPAGVPPLWPVSKARVSLPVIGRCGDWRERLIAGASGLAAAWLFATVVFLPLLHAESRPALAASHTHVVHDVQAAREVPGPPR